MKTRIISAIIAFAITIPLILLGGQYFAIFIGVLALLGYKEIVSLKKVDKNTPLLVKILGGISLLLIVFANYDNNLFLDISYYRLLIPLILLFVPTIFYKNKYKTETMFYLYGIILFLGLGFNSLLFIRTDMLILIYLFAITILGDTFAMLFGMLIGRNKLIPSISPNKTIEGSVGGFLIALIIPIIIYINLIGDFSFNLLLVTALLAAISQIGDLIFSKIKREHKIKDFSNIMPGHGGILDRLDSILLVSIFYMILKVFL